MRVLRYPPTNLSAPEIARELSVSVMTVRTNVSHVFVKVEAYRRTEAVARARDLGLLAPFPCPAPVSPRDLIMPGPAPLWRGCRHDWPFWAFAAPGPANHHARWPPGSACPAFGGLDKQLPLGIA